MSKSENTPARRRPSGTSAGAPNHDLKKKFLEGGVPDSWTFGIKCLFIKGLGVHGGGRLWTVPSIGKVLHEAASATGRLAQLALVRYPLAERGPIIFPLF